MNRRIFLLSPLLAAGCRKLSHEDSYVRNFPKELPEIRLVQPYLVHGSSYVFVQVRQTHRINREESAILEPVQNGFDVDEKALARLASTEAIQNDIYNTLKYARQRDLTTKVIREGMDGSSANMDDMWQQLHWTKNARREIQRQKRTMQNADFLDLMERYLPLLEREIMTSIGAQGRLAKEGVLEQIVEAEERPEKNDPLFVQYIQLDREYQALHATYLQAYSKHSAAKTVQDLEALLRKKSDEIELVTNSREWEQMNERREDALLETCSRKGPGVYWAVFGGRHDWADNISRRNANHSNKFSLIVLTPEHYPQEVKRK